MCCKVALNSEYIVHSFYIVVGSTCDKTKRLRYIEGTYLEVSLRIRTSQKMHATPLMSRMCYP